MANSVAASRSLPLAALGQRSPSADGIGEAARVSVLPTALPRRLALVTVPHDGESLPSWVDRLAADHQIPPGLAVLNLGLEVRDRKGDVRPIFYGLALTETGRRRLLAATGSDAATLDALQLSRYDGTALDLTGLDQPEARDQARMVSGARQPGCLAGAPVWPTLVAAGARCGLPGPQGAAS